MPRQPLNVFGGEPNSNAAFLKFVFGVAGSDFIHSAISSSSAQPPLGVLSTLTDFTIKRSQDFLCIIIIPCGSAIFKPRVRPAAFLSCDPPVPRLRWNVLTAKRVSGQAWNGKFGMFDFQIKEECEIVKNVVRRNAQRKRPWYV